MIVRSRLPRPPWDHGHAPRNLQPHTRASERIFDSARVTRSASSQKERKPRTRLLKFIEITLRTCILSLPLASRKDSRIMRELIVKSVFSPASLSFILFPRDLNLAAFLRAARRAIPCRKPAYVPLMHHAGGRNPLAKIKRGHYTGYPGICVVIFLNYSGRGLRSNEVREFPAERGK